jgi:hypothetical protein
MFNLKIDKKKQKGFVYFNYIYRLLFIALFDDFNLIISILVHHFIYIWVIY